jgi:kynurenine formamidase
MPIDLTYPIHKGMFVYSSNPEPKIVITPAQIQQEDEIIYDESGFTSGFGLPNQKYKSGQTSLDIRNHHGTHVDAPAHKIPGGKTIDSYPLKKFINNLGFVNLIKKDLMFRAKKEITLKDIESDLAQLEGNNLGALIFYTGFCDLMRASEGKYTGSQKINFETCFPYFSQEAAKHIAENFRGLNIVGIDSFAVDPSGSNSEVHRIFFEKDILPLETLVNLDELAKYLRFHPKLDLFCVPLNYEKADAAQTRAYAMETEDKCNGDKK